MQNKLLSLVSFLLLGINNILAINLTVGQTTTLSITPPAHLTGCQWYISRPNDVIFTSSPSSMTTSVEIKAINSFTTSSCVVQCTYYYHELDPMTGRYIYGKSGHQLWYIFVSPDTNENHEGSYGGDSETSKDKLIILDTEELIVNELESKPIKIMELINYTVDGECNWTIDDSTIANIESSSNGWLLNVTGLNPGTTYLRVHNHNSARNSVKLTVNPASFEDGQSIEYKTTQIGLFLTVMSASGKSATLDYISHLEGTILNIPQKIASLSINELSSGVISNRYSSTIKQVIIPSTINEIKKGNFLNFSQLENIVLPKSIKTIGDRSFEGCSKLNRIYLPENISSIGEDAFKDCKTLTDVFFDESLISIGSGAFSSCENLSTLNLPRNLQTIGSNCFQNCTSLKDVYINPSLKQIGNGSFSKCENIENVYLSDLSSWFNIEIENYKTGTPLQYTKNVVYNNEVIEDLIIPSDVNVIKFGAFAGYKNLKTIQIPESVTEIRTAAFLDCPNLQSINIININPPIVQRTNAFDQYAYETVTLIVPSSAINNYRNHEIWGKFKSIVGESGDESSNEFTYQGINYVVLDGVDGYTNVIASNVVSGLQFAMVADGNIACPIAEGKKYGYLPTSQIKEDAVGIQLSEEQSICNFTIESAPDGDYYIKDSYGRYVYLQGSYNSFNVSYDLPEEGAEWSITFIFGENRAAIYNKTAEKTIQYDPKYQSYGAYADEKGILPKLYVANPLSTVTTSTKRLCMTKPGEAWTSPGSKVSGDLYIPETVSNGVEDFTVVAIGEWSFVYEKMSSVMLPNTILSIGKGALFCSTNFSSIELPKSLINLGDYVFCGSEMSSVFISSSLSIIGQYAFACKNLTKITVADDNPLYSSYEGVLYDKEGRRLISVPQGLTGDFSIPNTVSIIDQRAFESCSLSSITIPSSIRIIDDQAFVDAEFNEIYYNTTDPITAEQDIFSRNQYREVTLYVPAEAMEKIKVTEPWKNFEKIEAYDFNEYSALHSVNEAIEKARQLENREYSEPYIIDFEPIVTYANGAYTYISFDDTPFLIYKDNLGLEAGQIVNKGWIGRLHNYNGLLELVPLDDTEISGGEMLGKPDPVRIDNTIDLNKERVSAVVYIPNVVFNEATPGDRASFTGKLGNQYLIFYNRFATASQKAGTYDVLATIGIYYDQIEIQPIEFFNPDAVDEIHAEGHEDFYDLQGHRVTHPQKGKVYIQKKGQHFNKVLISM